MVTVLAHKFPYNWFQLISIIFFQELPAVLTYPYSGEPGIKLSNSTVIAKKVQFDAFRTKDRSPPGFRVRKAFQFWRIEVYIGFV
jgi:hypothetical protein